MLVAGNGYNCLSKFVFDGDTLNLDFRGEQFKARLQWFDSPESRKTGKITQIPEYLSTGSGQKKPKLH